MRLFEQVQVALGDATRVVDARPNAAADTLRLAAGTAYERVDADQVGPSSVTAEVLLVAMVSPRPSAEPGSPDGHLDRLLAGLAPGGRALLLVRAAPESLPVSVIADALRRGACQVTSVLPAETVSGQTAIVVQRAEEILAAATFLEGASGQGGVADGERADAAYIRRALNELVLTRFAARGWSRRCREVEEHRARLQRELAQASEASERQAAAASRREQELLDQVTGLRDELVRLRSSVSFQVARAVADTVHDPVRSAPRLRRTAALLARRYRSRRADRDGSR